MGIEELKARVAALLREHNIDEMEVPVEEYVSAGYPRIKWERQAGERRRYARFTPLDDEFVGEYGVLFGQWVSDAKSVLAVSYPDQFDGRRVGDLEYCAAFLHAWLIEMRDPEALPPMRGEKRAGGRS